MAEANMTAIALLVMLSPVNGYNVRGELDRRLTAMGLAPHVRVGVIANAWHESNFDPTLMDYAGGELFIGLFQIRYAGRTRQLYTPAYLRTVNGNLYAISHRDTWKRWIKNPGRTAKEAALRFAAIVEACKPKHYAARGVTADRWWRER